MDKEDITTLEGEVVTYKRLKNWYGDDSTGDMLAIKLVCMNCDYLDTVMGMRVKKIKDKNFKDKINDSKNLLPGGWTYGGSGQDPIKWGTTTDKQKQPRYKLGSTSSGNPHIETTKECLGTETSDIRLEIPGYEDYFKCPECGSTAITLADGEIENIIADLL